jgi:hypothetical protein
MQLVNRSTKLVKTAAISRLLTGTKPIAVRMYGRCRRVSAAGMSKGEFVRDSASIRRDAPNLLVRRDVNFSIIGLRRFS